MNLEGYKLYLLQKGLAKTTCRSYITTIKCILAECDFSDQEKVAKYLASKLEVLSFAGYNHYIKSARQYCYYLQIPPYSFLKKITEQPKSRILLSDNEIESLIAVDPPPSKWGMFWTTLAYTGARPAEICGLRQQDIDLSLGIIYIHHSKTGKPRKIPLVDPLKKTLENYLKTLSGTLLFPNERDVPIHYVLYKRDWIKRLEDLGVKKLALPYSLRHSFITNSLGNGANLFSIQDVVGHGSSQTTRKYYHGNIDLMKKAVQKLPLAQKQIDPEALIDQMSELIDEYLMKDKRFNKDEILEAKKYLYRSIKKK